MKVRCVTILGDGAMAAVCANTLAGLGHRVTLWGPFPEHIETLRATHRNERYLPAAPRMDESVRYSADAGEAARGSDLLVCAIPTQFIRSVCVRFVPHLARDIPVVSVAKGIECETLLRPTQVIRESLDTGGQAAGGAQADTGEQAASATQTRGTPRKVAALSGPSIAEEMAMKLPCTLCAASEDGAFAKELQSLFSTPWLRVYTNDDLIGVELAGALKNVIALAAGILDGRKAGYNAKSALLARGLAEIARLGAAMGAKGETFFGITGVGDLATTCFHPMGRNRRCGEYLGSGMSLEEAQAKIQGIVEGVATTRSVVQLARRKGVEMPITEAVHGVLFEGLDAGEAISRLMTRSPKREKVG